MKKVELKKNETRASCKKDLYLYLFMNYKMTRFCSLKSSLKVVTMSVKYRKCLRLIPGSVLLVTYIGERVLPFFF